MYSSAIAKLELRVENLEETIDELTKILYNQLGINKDKLEPQSATKMSVEAWHKWVEANYGKFERTNILTKEEIYNQMKVTQIDPVEAEYYRQVDKAIKEEE